MAKSKWKDVKDKLSKLGIKNIKGVLSSENAPKIFEGAIKVLPELSEIFDKEIGEKREIYYSILGDVFADDFKILTNGDEKDYKNIDVEISSLAKRAFKQAVTVSEKQIKSTDTRKVEALPVVKSVKRAGTVSNVRKIEPKVNYKENDNNTQSVQDEEKKEEKKISGGAIAGIVLGVTGAIGLVVGSYFIYKNCCSNTNVVDSDVGGGNGVSHYQPMQRNIISGNQEEINPARIEIVSAEENRNLINHPARDVDSSVNEGIAKIDKL